MNGRTIRCPSVLGFLAVGTVLGAIAFHSKTAAQDKPGHTTYYTHGRIYTNDPEHPWAEAVAVADGTISFIGKTDHGLLDRVGHQEDAATVDLHCPFLLP